MENIKNTEIICRELTKKFENKAKKFLILAQQY